jgi:tight adherence protein C
VTVTYLISILVFASVALLVSALALMVFSEERQVTRALRTVSDWESQQAAVAEPMLRPFRARVISPLAEAASRAIHGAVPEEARARMQHLLDLAGNPGEITPEGIAGLRIGLSAGALVLAVAGFALAGTGLSATSVVGTVAMVAIGALAPGLWLTQLRLRRQDQIRRALPDMLDMLTISVQAGLGFDIALAKLVRTTTGPLPREFARMLNEVQAGVTRRDAFRHLGARTEVPELNNFIVAMVQADVFGVSISGILHTQSSELRKKRRAVAEEKAQKAPVQMVFPIILCILPATMLVILGPAVISIGRAFGLLE